MSGLSGSAPVCAIDSLPLKRTIFETFDYSGLQVHGPAHVSLSQAALWTRLDAGGTRLELALEPGLRWDDEEPITGADFARGMLEVFEANAFVKKVLFRHLTSLEPTRSGLVARFRKPSLRARECLSLPNFAPFRAPGLFSGAYAMEQRGPGEYRYRRRRRVDAPLDSFSVRDVKNPEENLLRFQEGSLDVTADTAFPFERWRELKEDPFFQSRETGLRAALLFGGELSRPQARDARGSIARVAGMTDLSDILGGACSRTKRPEADDLPLAPMPRALRLAYDHFYPNLEVCLRLARALKARGCEIELVEDDYYAPRRECDLRFSIVRDLCPGRYSFYAAMPFNAVVRADQELRRRVLGVLERIEAEPDGSGLDVLYAGLDDVFSEASAWIPLYNIPSCYLSRLPEKANPLLRVAPGKEAVYEVDA